MSGYCGRGRTLGKAMVDFAFAAADQNEQDHADLKAAMDKGLLAAEKTGRKSKVARRTGSKRK